MSLIPKNDQNKKQKTSRRRQKKKRRTEDFSDSSSSESENEEGQDVEDEINEPINERETIEDAVLSDIEMEDADALSEDFGKIKPKVLAVNLTKTQLNDTSKNLNSGKIKENLKKDKKALDNDYLSLMFENYADDLDGLRTAPDFNERSLSILANTLKNGANIFDEETLRAVISK